MITDSSDKSRQNQEVSGQPIVPPRSPVLIPALDYSKGEVRLGLLTKDGRVPPNAVQTAVRIVS